MADLTRTPLSERLKQKREQERRDRDVFSVRNVSVADLLGPNDDDGYATSIETELEPVAPQEPPVRSSARAEVFAIGDVEWLAPPPMARETTTLAVNADNIRLPRWLWHELQGNAVRFGVSAKLPGVLIVQFALAEDREAVKLRKASTQVGGLRLVRLLGERGVARGAYELRPLGPDRTWAAEPVAAQPE